MILGSISVSGQQPTYLSPNPSAVNWWQVRVNVGLGEGQVGSCLDTDIDPNIVLKSNVKVLENKGGDNQLKKLLICK